MTKRQPRGVPVGGQFAADARGEAAVAAPVEFDPMTAAPADVDARIMQATTSLASSRRLLERRTASLAAMLDLELEEPGSRSDPIDQELHNADLALSGLAGSSVEISEHVAQGLRGGIVEQQDAVRGHRDEIEALDDAFVRRGGWPRVYMTADAKGHAHSNTSCHTLHKGSVPTQMAWVTEASGWTEAELVESAGSRACSVCYPSAPSRRSAAGFPTHAAWRKTHEKKPPRPAPTTIRGPATADGSPLDVEFLTTRIGGTAPQTLTFQDAAHAQSWYMRSIESKPLVEESVVQGRIEQERMSAAELEGFGRIGDAAQDAYDSEMAARQSVVASLAAAQGVEVTVMHERLEADARALAAWQGSRFSPDEAARPQAGPASH